MKKIILSLCLLCSTIGLNAQSGEHILTDTIVSKVLNAKRAYTVVLPRSFYQQPDQKYPILYLLHGMWGKNDDWVNTGRVTDVIDRLTASGEIQEMIVVTPDAGGGDPNIYQNGYFDMPGWRYETFFLRNFCLMSKISIVQEVINNTVPLRACQWVVVELRVMPSAILSCSVLHMP